MVKNTTTTNDDTITLEKVFDSFGNAIVLRPTIAAAAAKICFMVAEPEHAELVQARPASPEQKTAAGTGLSKFFRAAGVAVGFAVPALTIVLAFNKMADYDVGPVLTPLVASAGIMASISVGVAVIGVSRMLSK